MASYRYRAEIPAKTLGCNINDFSADILIFAKPQEQEVELARKAQHRGAFVIADFCDDHFDQYHYRDMLALADVVTCPTQGLADRIGGYVVPDPYEFEEAGPHCNGVNLLWFGHATNIGSINRIRHELSKYPLRVVSNYHGCIPWSLETMREEFAQADIVVLPSTREYKSPNRAVESIRQGCFVVAEPHPSLTGLPIYIGDIPKGIEWARQNTLQANQQTKEAQSFVRNAYSPQTQANAWKTIFRALNSISAAGKFVGMVGST